MSTIPRTSGIYQIRCLSTGKVYIGSAVNLRGRYAGHWSALRRGVHKNRHLQAAWCKYGGATFAFHVLELTPAETLLDREQFYLDQFHATDRRFGFNIALVAGSHRGIKRSDETRRKLSALHLGRKHGPMSPERRAALGASKRGKTYRKHSAETNRQKSMRQQGHVVATATRAKIGAAMRGRPPSAATQAAATAAKAKRWIITDPQGHERVIVNLEAFCREHGLWATLMGRVARGQQTQHKGWRCRLWTSSESSADADC